MIMVGEWGCRSKLLRADHIWELAQLGQPIRLLHLAWRSSCMLIFTAPEQWGMDKAAAWSTDVTKSIIKA